MGWWKDRWQGKKIEVGGVRIATVRGLGYCLEKFVDPARVAGADALHATK